MDLSLASIFIGLFLLMFLAYKGHSIIWVAPLCAAIVAFLSGMNLLEAYVVLPDVPYSGHYMRGVANFVRDWFPAFFLGAVYGKVMDMTGAARSLADKLVKLIGPQNAVAAVVLPCMAMTLGGISLFVVVFVIYPMGYAIYRAANLPRTLLPGAIAFGAFGITMTAVPGTPQIQNLIPMRHFGTTAMAAIPMSLAAIALMAIPGYLYLTWRARKCKAAGLGFVEDPKFVEQAQAEQPSWHWLSALLPMIVVILLLNAFDQHIVTALLGGILVCCIMNLHQAKILLPAISAGANGSLIAIMNTSCAVGFGWVVRAVPGFAALTVLLTDMPGNLLVSQAVAVNLLAGATGSASGGMGIALDALGPTFLAQAQEIGMNPEWLHRIASIASGGLDTLPHNGAVLTLLAVSNCTHKESYFDIGIANLLIPTASSLILAFVWGSFVLYM